MNRSDHRWGFYLVRVLRVGLGFLVAVIAASAVVLVFGFNNGRPPELSSGALMLWGASLGLVSAYGAALMLPALIVAGAAEVMGWRAAAFHAGLGLAGALGAYLYVLREDLELADHPLLATLAAGLVGGLVYWLLAGRSAGLQPAKDKTA